MADNVQIVAGTDIPSPTGVKTNYQFELFDFRDIEAVTLNADPSDSDLKIMMSGKTTMLRLHTIGDTGGLNTTGEFPITSISDVGKLNQMPCCIISKNGSVIPQIIVPSDNVKIADNGIAYDVDQRESELSGEGYTWTPTKLVTTSPDADDLDTYGKRDVTRANVGYVSMDGCCKKSIDNPIIANRTYNCDTSASGAGKGSCAICYHFTSYNGSGEGTTEQEMGTTPQMVVSLNDSGGTKAIVVSIPPTGDIIARVGSDVSSGPLAGIQSAILPPHINKIGNDWNMNPVYIYPLYSGFVITNDATRSAKESSSSVYISYGKVQDPISAIKINGVIKTDEVTKLITQAGSEMQFFPSLFQESTSQDNIKLEVNSENRIKMGTTINLQWLKSYGRFAYCPIYFHRIVRMTLYFKGEYVPEGGTAATYKFYPIVCADVASGVTSEYWTGVNGDGATSITATHVVSDDALQEGIYKVVIEMKANQPQRYPIEIFGCVKVQKKTEHPFGIKNGDGKFVFDKDFKKQFSWLYNNRYETENKDYLDFITDVSVQSSLGDVSGSLSFDAYPIYGNLDNIKVAQSIGQLNLKIKDDTKNIFTGYGMELKSNVSESSHTVGVTLAGVQKKLEDMKLAAAPFWDGDRLQSICAYFESYAKITLKMVNFTTTTLSGGLHPAFAVGTTVTGSTGTWKSNSETVVNTVSIEHPDFRVPRSFDWRKPAVDFQTGTSCLEALNKLAEMVSCAFVVQPDGIGYFFELNDYGIPYYVYNQDEKNVVSFPASEIISVNISPYLENKYNCFVTFGFLQKRDKKDNKIVENSVQMGAMYTLKDVSDTLVDYPWARAAVNVENGFLTKSELGEIHANNVKFGVADIYQGTVTVPGNTQIDHIYQRIKVCGIDFFVISIDHNINLQSKEWTTSYGLNAFNLDSSSSSEASSEE